MALGVSEVKSDAMTTLSLESGRWRELTHAYGPATDIPPLLRDLEAFPSSSGNAEPWFSLWSALCHQDDVYPASFAAVPHIVRVLALAPTRADASFFQLPACVEIARFRKSVPVPTDLHDAYFEALRRLPSLVAAAAEREWDEDFLVCVMSALACAKGFPTVADAALELTPSVAEEFKQWFLTR